MELPACLPACAQENQSLYALGKHITSCTYDPLPPDVPQPLRELVTAMLQPSPQQRPTVGQLVQACQMHGPQMAS
jgi:hypothetical protein